MKRKSHCNNILCWWFLPGASFSSRTCQVLGHGWIITTHRFQWYVIAHPCLISMLKIMVRTTNFIPLFHVDGGTCAYVSSTSSHHQMETFSALLAICAGNSSVPGEFPTQRPVTRSFDVLVCARIKGWVNSREAGDLRRHRAHYDVIVMHFWLSCSLIS